MSNSKQTPVPQYLIERLAKGELPQAQADAIRARLELEEGGVDKAMQQLTDSDNEIFVRHPAHVVANEIYRRANNRVTRPSRARPFFLPALALGTLGALALLALAPNTARRTEIASELGEETIGIKGSKPHLVVYRKRLGAPERLTPHDVVHPGDVLQVAYVVPVDPNGSATAYGIVVSIDAAKAITMHLPMQDADAQVLKTNSEDRLPNAYELDASKGFESFWLVTKSSPFNAKEAADALANGRPLPAGTSTFHITFTKELL
jgi:hypothetical protein